MKFDASDELIGMVNQVKSNLFRNYFILILQLLGGFFFLYKLAKYVDLTLIIADIMLLGFVLLIARSQTIPKGLTISNTAMEVNFFEDRIVIRTIPFKVWFWVNRPSIELEFKLRHFFLKKVFYPVKAIYDLDTKIWQVSSGGKEIYIIADYFDPELNRKLAELK